MLTIWEQKEVMLVLGQRGNKYRNYKGYEIDGIKFDSKKEAIRYKQLKLLERAGKISDLHLQVPFEVIKKSQYGNAIRYYADFVYFDKDENKQIVEDTKGFRTDIYKIKKRLLAEQYGIEIKET